MRIDISRCLEDKLRAVVVAIDARQPSDSCEWSGWAIKPVRGGANNRLYRAQGPVGAFAVKFTLDDARDRAGREYGALATLRRAGLRIAPRPILLDRTSFSLPVVVAEWLDGPVELAAPTNDDDWLALIDHFLAIHTVTPAGVDSSLPRAVVTAFSAEDAIQLIYEHLERIPSSALSDEGHALLRRVEAHAFPSWPEAVPALCRCDANTRNVIRRSGGWASVDWENSGWGDPAYEIAELLSHPTYAAVSDDRRAWLIDAYCQSAHDPLLPLRISTYYKLSLVWWVARLSRLLYEAPRGLDERLAVRPAHWLDEARQNLHLYLERAAKAFAGPELT